MNHPGLIEVFSKGSAAFRKLNSGLLRQEEARCMAQVTKPRKSKGNALLAHAQPIPTSTQIEDSRLLPSPLPECAVQDAALHEGKGEEGYASRVHVRVTSYRRRLTDPDNLTPKYFLDCLRYAGILRDDRAADIELSTAQKKVGRKEEERTEIEIVPCS